LFEAVDRLKAEIDRRSNHMKIQNDRFGFLQPSCIFEESKDPNIERGIGYLCNLYDELNFKGRRR